MRVWLVDKVGRHRAPGNLGALA